MIVFFKTIKYQISTDYYIQIRHSTCRNVIARSRVTMKFGIPRIYELEPHIQYY